MHSTLVIQSHTDPLPFAWIKRCIDSVKSWSDLNQFNYQWLGDELFSYIDADLREKTSAQRVVATDIARLRAIRESLERYERVLWLDADFLIFRTPEFVLPKPSGVPLGYMLGREIWIQEDQNRTGKLRAYVKVHNAFMLFDRGNHFLDFYLSHAEQLVRACEGPMSPQFVGPKLLAALHNVVQCPVLEQAGMLSPMVIRDMLSNGQSTAALSLLRQRSRVPLAGANLCSSLVNQECFSEPHMNQLIDKLLLSGVTF